MAQFKQYLTHTLEEKVSALPAQGYDDTVTRVTVAQMTFAFRNAKMINWLKKRGQHIQKEEWDKLEEINDEIAESLKDNDQLDALQTPCSAFVTFLTEEGIMRAEALPRLVKNKEIDPAIGILLGDKFDI